MQRTETIFLEDGGTRDPYPATLIAGVTTAAMQSADAQWQPFLARAVAAALARRVPRYDLPENKHWEWERKAKAMLPGSLAFAIEADVETQALMIVRTDKTARLPEQSAQPLVYIDYLSAAPWNLSGLMAQPRFRKAGLRMVQAAIRHSVSLGWGGRLGLHSLQGAERFYRDYLGMRDLGVDAGYENLRYFEMTAAIAALI